MKGELKKPLFYLIGSTALTLLIGLTALNFWKKQKIKRLSSNEYQITSIIQTGPEKEALKTAYLAELLELSADRPTQLYALDLKKAATRLLASPLIASAKVKRMPPSTLYIDYEVRKPIAWVADFRNLAIDSEGHCFPVAPFLTPKRLPEIYLGISSIEEWRLKNPAFDLALKILKFLETAPWTEDLRIERVDVSNAFHPSLGMREVVLITEEEFTLKRDLREIVCTFPKILRLGTKEYERQLDHFFHLRRAMMEDYKKQLTALKTGGRFAPRIIDLRIPQLAFVEKG